MPTFWDRVKDKVAAGDNIGADGRFHATIP